MSTLTPEFSWVPYIMYGTQEHVIDKCQTLPQSRIYRALPVIPLPVTRKMDGRLVGYWKKLDCTVKVRMAGCRVRWVILTETFQH